MTKKAPFSEIMAAIIEGIGHGNTSDIARRLGTNEANLRGYTGKTGKKIQPKYELLRKIVKNLEIDARWLLTGEGEMLRKVEPEAPSCTENEILTLIKSLNDKIDNMSSQIEDMKKTDARPDGDAACAAAG